MSSRYVPVLRLAMGEMADVYLGVLQGASGFRRTVVMKRAFAGVRGNPEKARAQLVAEADLAFAVAHPHNVSPLELAELPEGLVLVYEYLQGCSLHSLLRHLRRDQATVPIPVACALIADAALGLAHAHRVTGLPHGDISPRNLLLTDAGFVKVIDYTGSSESGRLTPAFASPEQARGEPATCVSDVFGLMLVLRELISGQTLFEGNTPEFVLQRIANETVPSLGGPLDDLFSQTLTREPRHRLTDLEGVAESLRARAGAGGSRRQVRLFLQAEMGRALAQRAARVTAALRGHSSDAPPKRGTRTLAALDAFFDELPEGQGTLVTPTPPKMCLS